MGIKSINIEANITFFLLLFWYTLNNKRFIKITQRDPPKKPVNSYHWNTRGEFANTFPRVSHGHDKSQFRCKYSIDIHKTIKEKYPNLFEVDFFILWNNQKTIAIKVAFTKNAAIAPKKVAWYIQYVVIALNMKNVKNEYPKMCLPFTISSSTISNGRKAIKINGNTPIDGQENASNTPLNNANNSFFMNLQILSYFCW